MYKSAGAISGCADRSTVTGPKNVMIDACLEMC